MTSHALTDIAIRAFPSPEKGQRTHWDSVVPGFGVRVSQGGTKTFVLMHGRDRQLTVHYDPDYPSDSVLETGDALARQRMVQVVMFAALPFVFGLLALMVNGR